MNISGGGYYTGSKHHHVGFNFNALAKQRVISFNVQISSGSLGNSFHIGFGKHYTGIVLKALVQDLVLTGCADVFVKDERRCVIVCLAYVLGLLQ